MNNQGFLDRLLTPGSTASMALGFIAGEVVDKIAPALEVRGGWYSIAGMASVLVVRVGYLLYARYAYKGL